MDLSDELFDEINQLLSGKLQGKAKEDLLKKIKEDPELEAEVALQKEIKENMMLLSMMDERKKALMGNLEQLSTNLKNKGILQEEENEIEEPQPVMKVASRRTFYMGIAASIAILMGFWWFIGREGRQNQEFYAIYFNATPKSPDPELMGSATAEDKDFASLTDGLRNLNNGQLKEAIRKFENLSNANTTYWGSVAKWYLSLAYLKDNQREKAIQTLREIVSEKDHTYKNEAEKLLKELE